MNDLYLLVKELGRELTLHTLKGQIDLIKKKVGEIDNRIFCKYRDERDDYGQYLQWVKRLENFVKQDGVQVKQKLLPWMPDDVIYSLPHFFTFLNRCTIKLAELDVMSQRAISHAHKFTKKRSYLRFLDLCGGPGGFTEYLLLMHRWDCKGLGITLRGPSDYQIHKFHSNALCSSFVSFTDIEMSEGNILQSETQQSLINILRAKLDKVDLVLADGAYDIDGNEENQELNLIPLLLAELYLSFQSLEDNGTLLIKFFNISCSETLLILHILKSAFIRLALLKPNTSRKSNSERYILCQGFRIKYAVLKFEEISRFVYGVRKVVIPSQSTNADENSPSITVEEQELFLSFEHLNLHLYWAEFATKVRDHLLLTWKLQLETLTYLVDKTLKEPMIRPKLDVHSIDDCFTNLAFYFRQWQFGWVHGLTQQIPSIKFETKRSLSEKTSPPLLLFDNWNQLHQDSTFLSIMKNYVMNWMGRDAKYKMRIVHLTNQQQLLDINSHPIMAHNVFLQNYQKLPCNTICLIINDEEIYEVIVIPKYPKLFLRDRRERNQLFADLIDRSFWWSSDYRSMMKCSFDSLLT